MPTCISYVLKWINERILSSIIPVYIIINIGMVLGVEIDWKENKSLLKLFDICCIHIWIIPI